ncbi:unnamed protein product [Hydatigera taeniaeformis]|uniref:Uncharacterized protein n=1 Tax=Hydatigena taeniaeformis TaxID=6205 RepID=A0A0R3XDM6_HYDTA|nr:unnamed protein product [Hydatigera taeniaeformis]
MSYFKSTCARLHAPPPNFTILTTVLASLCDNPSLLCLLPGALTPSSPPSLPPSLPPSSSPQSPLSLYRTGQH